jgi:uncharacterized protein (TIGR03000 family)
MYSIALLMALTGGNEVADGHRHGGCGGCGGYVASCGCGGGGHHRHHGHRHHGGGCGCYGYQAACGGCGECGGCGSGGCGYAPVSYGCYGAGYGCGGGYVVPAAPAGHGEPIKAMPAPKATWVPAPAVIVVELPADATLKVDGEATTSTSNVRVLVSPDLPAGQEFHYTLTAQVVRDGKPVQLEQTVAVRAGEESRVSLTLPTVNVAQR